MASKARQISLWDAAILRRAVTDSFAKLDPRIQIKNPAMFIVGIRSVLTTGAFFQQLFSGTGDPLFTGQVAFWLWFTVIFANFAEAVAEGRGKAQADTLRKTRTQTIANRVGGNGRLEKVPAADLRKGDVVAMYSGGSGLNYTGALVRWSI